MSARELFTFRNPYFSAGVGVAAGLFVLTALGGFIVLPYAQPELKFASLWDAICSAAGLPKRTVPVPTAKVGPRLSEAILTSTTLARPSQESIGRGATLAQRCAICHGPTGVSRADSPNLAGQYAAVIYKQMLDFRSGARTNAVMSPFAVNLTDQEIADLSAYYAYLPRLPAYHPTPQLPRPRIVIYGAPVRGCLRMAGSRTFFRLGRSIRRTTRSCWLATIRPRPTEILPGMGCPRVQEPALLRTWRALGRVAFGEPST